jgi:filamentous hemagglutinin
VLWQRQAGSGSTVETLTLPSFTGPSQPTFTAPGGLSVQIPTGDFKTQIQSLSQQPGMTYLQTLTTRTDVNWQPVKLAYDQWSYDQQGLTPAGAALLSVAVACATGGAGAGLVGATGPTTSLMANAAFSSLASQASITLINNKGDLGKTLKDLGRSSTVKATVAAALTAGALDKISTLPGMTTLSQSKEFTDKLTVNLVNAGGRALTNTAINGGSLEDALKSAMIGGLVDTVHGQVASKIALQGYDYLTHKLAHALAGCAAGAAAQGTCKDGAIGGAMGEVVAEMFKGQVPAWNAPEAEWAAFDAKVKDYGKVVAGTIAAYAGGNAQTAITTAETAIDNNARITYRVQAMQQQLSSPQFWLNLRAQSLQQAIVQNGGTVPGNMTTPGARVNYTQADINSFETQLRALRPQHELIYNPPSATLSPLPSSYVNFQYAVNMTNISTGNTMTAFGFPRDSSAFFRELLRTNPQLFSADNIARIMNRESPRVDPQWVQYNPTHQAFINSTLVHHHWMQGNIAVPIPEPIHIRWNSTFHPYR